MTGSFFRLSVTKNSHSLIQSPIRVTKVIEKQSLILSPLTVHILTSLCSLMLLLFGVFLFDRNCMIFCWIPSGNRSNCIRELSEPGSIKAVTFFDRFLLLLLTPMAEIVVRTLINEPSIIMLGFCIFIEGGLEVVAFILLLIVDFCFCSCCGDFCGCCDNDSLMMELFRVSAAFGC
jgi:hypothetical protein